VNGLIKGFLAQTIIFVHRYKHARFISVATMATQAERLLLLYDGTTGAGVNAASLALLEHEILNMDGMRLGLLPQEWRRLVPKVEELLAGWKRRGLVCGILLEEYEEFLQHWLQIVHQALTWQPPYPGLNNEAAPHVEGPHGITRQQLMRILLPRWRACRALGPESEPGRTWVVEAFRAITGLVCAHVL
jgi:hypothetical protein